MPAATARCKGCVNEFVSLGIHLGRNEACSKAYWVEHDELVEENERLIPQFEAALYADKRKAFVFPYLAEMYWFRYLGAALMKVLRLWIEACIAFALREAKPEIERIAGKVKSDEIYAVLEHRLDLFQGLSTEEQVRAYACATRPILRPVQISLGIDKHAYGIFLLDWVVALMRHDSVAREHIIKESEFWKTGALRQPKTVISSWTHGKMMEEHAFSEPHSDKEGGASRGPRRHPRRVRRLRAPELPRRLQGREEAGMHLRLDRQPPCGHALLPCVHGRDHHV